MKKQLTITKEDLEGFMGQLDDFTRKVEGIKSTIAILQDRESMQTIRESENNREEKKDLEEFIY
ncbi:MAG: hypothetical protein KJ905_02300 [Nanoarchaeota archaeon]|nr:hypothetical protein [Nanoarchaeota archaeon]MBU1501582.1 hypothetical protein [Nanoarchaeota archaeon]